MNAKSIFAYIAAWMTIGLGSIPQQDIFQRVMASKSEKVAVYSSLLGSFLFKCGFSTFDCCALCEKDIS